MKKLYIFILLLTGISCDVGEDIFEENFIRGGLVEFSEAPETTSFNFLNASELLFTADLEDPNNNVTSYNLALTYGTITVDDFLVLTSFPASITITTESLLAALGLTLEDLDLNTSFDFLATVTTPTGVFVGLPPSFDFDTNTSTGGNTSNNLFVNSPTINQALSFRLTFFIPPPRKLRGTSFEEPFGTGLGQDYTRPDAEANTTAELLNIDGQRNVMYSAVGDGVDDEIGFRTFFINNGRDGGSGSGFTSEEIGVSNDPGEVGSSFLDGNQAYQVEDSDGIIRIEFDRVAVDPAANPNSGIQIQYFPAATGNDREEEDSLIVTVLIERADGSSETIELLNIDGIGINEGIGRWNLVSSGFLENITAYTLTIETDVNGGSEDTYFDQMLVFIPE